MILNHPISIPKFIMNQKKDEGVKDLFIVDFTSTTVSDSKGDVIKCLEYAEERLS